MHVKSAKLNTLNEWRSSVNWASLFSLFLVENMQNKWRTCHELFSHSFRKSVNLQGMRSAQFLTWALFPWAHLYVVRMIRFMFDINQPSLPTPFYSVPVSVSVFMALSTVFHSINSPDNSPLSRSLLPLLFFASVVLSTTYLFMKTPLSPDESTN